MNRSEQAIKGTSRTVNCINPKQATNDGPITVAYLIAKWIFFIVSLDYEEYDPG